MYNIFSSVRPSTVMERFQNWNWKVTKTSRTAAASLISSFCIRLAASLSNSARQRYLNILSFRVWTGNLIFCCSQNLAGKRSQDPYAICYLIDYKDGLDTKTTKEKVTWFQKNNYTTKAFNRTTDPDFRKCVNTFGKFVFKVELEFTNSFFFLFSDFVRKREGLNPYCYKRIIWDPTFWIAELRSAIPWTRKLSEWVTIF